jgi:hypothetical protein
VIHDLRPIVCFSLQFSVIVAKYLALLLERRKLELQSNGKQRLGTILYPGYKRVYSEVIMGWNA